MTKVKFRSALTLVGMTAVLTPFSTIARAAGLPIVEGTGGPGAFTFDYNAGLGEDTTYATPVGLSYIAETAGQGGYSYYYPTAGGDGTSAPATGTISYTFTAAPGQVFSGNATSQEHSLVAYNLGGSVSETVTVAGDPTPVFSQTLATNPDGGRYEPTAAVTFDVDGASSFTITYSLVNTSSTNIFTQVFREVDGQSNEPFQVTGATISTPEPASLSLLGFGALGLLARRRQR